PLRGAGRRVRAAPAARPETVALRRRGRRVEAHVARLRRERRAGRAAVDAGGGDGGHEPPVEPGVAARDGPVAALEVQLHDLDTAPGPWPLARGNRTWPWSPSGGSSPRRSRAATAQP